MHPYTRIYICVVHPFLALNERNTINPTHHYTTLYHCLGVDCAATSIGFPIRNMHTISETGHTGDVLAALHAVHGLVEMMESEGIDRDYFKENHPRLDRN